MGAKPDLEIMGFIAREMGVAAALGPWTPDAVFEEIRAHGARLRYSDAGAGHRRRGADHAGRTAASRVEKPAGAGAFRSQRLFASGTLGRYSKVLNSVLEGRLSR